MLNDCLDFIDSNFFYALYDSDDNCIMTFDSLNDISIFLDYRIDRVRYAFLHHTYLIYNNSRVFIHYFYKFSILN